MKKRKVRSFSRRLTKRLVLTLLIVMGLASLFIFALGGSFIVDDEQQRHENMREISA